MTATAPLYTRCARCGVRVLEVRWDWAEGALFGEPRVDPVSLDREQLTACIVIGIQLWQVHPHAGRTVTSKRTRWWPRQPMPGYIAPVHACGRVWDAFPIDLAPDEITYPTEAPF